jgi:hypothetical protein
MKEAKEGGERRKILDKALGLGYFLLRRLPKPQVAVFIF